MENESVLVKGLCERIGTDGRITHKVTGAKPFAKDHPMPTHKEAISLVLSLLTDSEHGVITSIDEIELILNNYPVKDFKKWDKLNEMFLSILNG